MGKSKTDTKSNNKGSNSKDKSKDASSSSSKKATKGDSKSDKLKPASSINVRHILCEKHSKMETVLERLANGEKFDAVARELSEDKARQGRIVGVEDSRAFEDAAYALAVSTVDRPVYTNPAVKTSEGYHCEFLRWFLLRLGDVWGLLMKIIGIMVEGRK
ncbi:unnamed protein product [Tuber aestivum]|uniref:Peptidyl-prolyl cis-trans isomerase n=1 Tax=Tuber aestivum TaxID=59557 RepID=A0A292PKE1_9PEZI|nr:unnamed protein product [Tuber aestivum]